METKFYISKKHLQEFLDAAKTESSIEVILPKKQDCDMLKVTVKCQHPFNLFYLGTYYGMNLKK